MKNNSLYTFFLVGLLFFAACTAPKPQQSETEETERLPSVIELVVSGDSASADKLKQICENHHINADAVYQWKNHFVIYDTLNNVEGLQKEIASAYPEAKINLYDVPFYVFDRRYCDNKNTTSGWSHTIMTANLVADTTMQKEYMDYHATQFEDWPEIANGFCNADFQQLLVFRNGRQLMLIISIPEGKNLDELNPKTTENNPRVDEWNAIMGKYQEGIEGTEADETWVVFVPVK